MRAIDMTPTWGEWGNLFYQFALLGEEAVLENMHPDMAKAFAFAEAFKAINASLSRKQTRKVRAVLETELHKQGVDIVKELSGND